MDRASITDKIEAAAPEVQKYIAYLEAALVDSKSLAKAAGNGRDELDGLWRREVELRVEAERLLALEKEKRATDSQPSQPTGAAT